MGNCKNEVLYISHSSNYMLNKAICRIQLKKITNQ